MAKPLKVGVIGPNGQCGSCVVDELLMRGHTVVGISRNPPKHWKGSANAHYSSISIDIHRENKRLIEAFSSQFDAIICAFGPGLSDLDKVYMDAVEAHGRIKTALLASDHTGPFIIIGGAGSIHIASHLQLVDQPEFAYSWWWDWPDEHLDYMRARAADHNTKSLYWIITLFKWSRQHDKSPGTISWLLTPVTRLVLFQIKKLLVSPGVRGLITGSRIAFTMWNGVRDKSWSFLSPPGLLRDKGTRTGDYKVFIDSPDNPAIEAAAHGIYNEDMAVAIVDEAENNKLAYQHWSCTGPIGLGRW